MARQRLLVGGKSGSGKNHLAVMTDAPGPVGVLLLDENGQVTTDRALSKGKKLIVPSINYDRTPESAKSLFASILNTDEREAAKEVRKAASNFLAGVVAAYQQLLNKPVRDCPTILIDGINLLWVDMLHAHWGKTDIMPLQRTGPNRAMGHFLNLSNDRNLILTTRVKTKWREVNGQAKPVAGSAEPRDPYPDLDYAVPNTVMLGRVEGEDDKKELLAGFVDAETPKKLVGLVNGLERGDWWGMVTKAHNNPTCVGIGSMVVNEDITYRTFMELCVPGWKGTD